MRSSSLAVAIAIAALMGACSKTEAPPAADNKPATPPNVVVVSEADANYNEGKRLVEANASGQELANAINMLLRSAELGNSDAQVVLAKLHQEGRGLPRNPGEAINLLLAASKKGNAEATYELGKAFEAGEGVDKNLGEAMNNYLKAGGAGNRDAMFAVAKAFEKGHGAPLSKDEAINWYRKAAEAGHPEAASRLKTIESH